MRNDTGLTLLELLIAMAITTGALVIVTTFALDISSFGLDLGSRLEGERALELTLRVMVSEVRSMGPGEDGSYPVAAASATGFTFFSDIDADGQFERVRYFLDGTTLKKGVIRPTTAVPPTYPPANEIVIDVVQYVRNATIFTYYPESYPPEATPLLAPIDVSLVRLVGVSGTIDIDPVRPPLASTLSVQITIRNLRGEI